MAMKSIRIFFVNKKITLYTYYCTLIYFYNYNVSYTIVHYICFDKMPYNKEFDVSQIIYNLLLHQVNWITRRSPLFIERVSIMLNICWKRTYLVKFRITELFVERLIGWNNFIKLIWEQNKPVPCNMV